jgi:uncharacterized protein (DUF433 family)
MNERRMLERVVIDPDVMSGKPVIKGTRLTVEYVLDLLAHGATMEEVLGEYDGLVPEDIRACLLFASKSLEDNMFMPLSANSGNPG